MKNDRSNNNSNIFIFIQCALLLKLANFLLLYNLSIIFSMDEKGDTTKCFHNRYTFYNFPNGSINLCTYLGAILLLFYVVQYLVISSCDNNSCIYITKMLPVLSLFG